MTRMCSWGNNRGANLGHMVSQKAEMNIKLPAYYLRYSEKISQVRQPTDLTVQAIHTIRDLCDSDGNCDDPKAPMINERDCPKRFDGMDEIFWKHYGITSMRSALVNAVLENHRSQATSGTPMSHITSPSSSASMRSPIHSELASFKKGIKREASACSILKDEHYFGKFQRDLFITAKSHDVSEILDPTFTPGPSPQENELFEAKQVFIYKVFNETLLTDMGRTKVRKCLKTTDAQAVWKDTLSI